MVRYSFLVGLFHPRLHAGLSRRLRSLAVAAQNGFAAGSVSLYYAKVNNMMPATSYSTRPRLFRKWNRSLLFLRMDLQEA